MSDPLENGHPIENKPCLRSPRKPPKRRRQVRNIIPLGPFVGHYSRGNLRPPTTCKVAPYWMVPIYGGLMSAAG